MGQLHLLPEEVLVKTGPVDHADWNFRPILGVIQRSRFRIALDLLGDERYGRLLEIGYGSGVFMPELARRCRHLHGIDIHARSAHVDASLRKLDLSATLCSGSAESMPFETAYFDAVVAVSSFEFIPDLDRACREIRRVLAPGGAFFLVTPGQSPLVDFGLKVLTGVTAERDYEGRRKDVMPALRRHFETVKTRVMPPAIHSVICLYRGLKLRAADGELPQ
ncbi:MAG TPA: class I SAM-dependent methyltransferase [Polyangiaceae bacterium]|nr:class I SAM-dependent methyltransferase [Polyangiaceae bacterium]